MKKIAWFLLVIVTVVSAVYVFRHLARWEWHRAMFAGIAMIAGEVALVGAVVVRAARRAVANTPARAATDERVRERLRESRPDSSRVFAWLRPQDGQLDVFVSILLGGGVVVSAAAWVVDRVAKVTSSGGLEKRLAAQLGRLQPPDGFVVDDATLMAAGRPVDDAALRLLLGPSADVRR